MNELLGQLSEARGVSGDEQEVRLLIMDLIKELADEIEVDALGSIRALKKGTGQSDLRIMVDAHMDEIGLMISSIETDGTCRFLKVGGIDDKVLAGKVVHVGKNRIPGVIGLRPLHLLKPNQRGKVAKADSLRIDIGASKKAEAAKYVSVGDYASFVTRYEEFGNTAQGKAFDDRVGCAILIELLRGEPFQFDLIASFSVQEELGLRGAGAAAFAARPDASLVLETTPALDLPGKLDISPNVRMKHGAAIYVMDARTIQNPRLVSHLVATAEREGIPYQIRRPGSGGTNAGAIQHAHEGIPSATMSVPVRYLHSTVSRMNLQDYDSVKNLADAALRGLKRETITVS